jgi:TolB protein
MKRGWILGAAVVIAALGQRGVVAQEPGGVRVGITYAPGTRPSLAVARTGTGVWLDSVRAILDRDLDHSDRFEMLWRPSAGEVLDSLAIARVARGGQAQLLLLVGAEPGAARLALIETRSGEVAWRGTVVQGDPGSREWRRGVHALADEVTRAVTGQRGFAASSILYVRGGRLQLVDADGHGAATLRSAGDPALSPAWSPDGGRIAYTAFVQAGQPLVVQNLATGERSVVPGTEYGLNITPAFSPDGRRLAFAQGTEAGTDIYVYDGGARATRLTVGRFADNLSPTWSPDGSRLAFISTRARTPQLYVMNADGTDQEVLARFDFGATGASNAPAWSPDGSLVVFHREVAGTPQLFVVDVASREVRQLTGGAAAGRNEDPSWAPDGRHLVFVSTRGGARDLWVMDIETGRLRQLTFVGGARLPAWSPRLATN